MAIDVGELFENTSTLTDHMLLHRLALVPLTSSAALQFLFVRECPCGAETHCSRCSVGFTLNVKNENAEPMTVYSKHLVPECPGPVKCVFDDMVLVKLAKHQQVRLRAIAKKGIGRDHAKYNPTTCFKFQSKQELFGKGTSSPYFFEIRLDACACVCVYSRLCVQVG